MPTNLPNERHIRAPGSLELDPEASDLSVDETSRLIAAGKVEGTAIYDRAGRQLGAVGSVMIDKISGQVAYVVMASGGFLGLGEDLYPLPWRALVYDPELGGYIVDFGPGAAVEGSAPLPDAAGGGLPQP